MELREIFQLVKKYWLIILIFSALFAGFALLVSLQKAQEYEVNYSLLIAQTKNQTTDQFKYDGFYSLETKDRLGDYLISLLKSPEIVNALLNEGGFKADNLKLFDLRSFFRAYKTSSQSIGINFSLKNYNQARPIINAMIKNLNANLAKVYQSGEKDIAYEVRTTNPLVTPKKPILWLVGLMGLLLGAFFGILVAFVKEYLTT